MLTTLGHAPTQMVGSEDPIAEHQEYLMAHRRRTSPPVDRTAQETEKNRRRHRTENGRSPAQLTTRSLDAYRANKRPGQRERRQVRQDLRGCYA